jgi:folate-binding Fe-S cluster repair protein YgfZ
MFGNAAQEEKLTAETSKVLPNGTIWNSVELSEIRVDMLRTRAIRRKPERCFSTSPHCGRTPTLTSLFFNKRKGNTPNCDREN